MHKDNNRMNNHVSNLQWGTYSMNNLQCSREGRGKQYRQKLVNSIQCMVK